MPLGHSLIINFVRDLIARPTTREKGEEREHGNSGTVHSELTAQQYPQHTHRSGQSIFSKIVSHTCTSLVYRRSIFSHPCTAVT